MCVDFVYSCVVLICFNANFCSYVHFWNTFWLTTISLYSKSPHDGGRWWSLVLLISEGSRKWRPHSDGYCSFTRTSQKQPSSTQKDWASPSMSALCVGPSSNPVHSNSLLCNPPGCYPSTPIFPNSIYEANF